MSVIGAFVWVVWIVATLATADTGWMDEVEEEWRRASADPTKTRDRETS
jgi:hypothetical protein